MDWKWVMVFVTLFGANVGILSAILAVLLIRT